MCIRDRIRTAWTIADKHHLHKPVVEQPQYNIFHRKRVENEYARLYEDLGLGLTTWSPLASGLLTGKYRDGVPADSRAAIPGMAFIAERVTDRAKNEAVGRLLQISDDIGCSLNHMAIAWAARYPRVSSVITGASRLSQLKDNMGALAVLPKLTDEVMARIDAVAAPLVD